MELVLTTVLVYVAIVMATSLTVEFVASPTESTTARLLVLALVALLVSWPAARAGPRRTHGPSPTPRPPNADPSPRRSRLLIGYWACAVGVSSLYVYITFFPRDEPPWSLISVLPWTLISVGFLMTGWVHRTPRS
ncbi:hypothetical protein LQ940_06765 [Nocardioides sp. cx-173]|uniref:hypothetical protein n=1 Tax=Nocardioides sp. cx-173 TaxID=2898796 RepID=UPI001E58AA86|nr:hypothetical protein [Nocardioides sp. cx-173]UGB43225.1 hypothetical protein LQ940_06765 [Nocardioides sp. cx-173]